MNIDSLAREIVATLVHLKEVRTGVPEHGQSGYDAIRAQYANTHASNEGDPMLKAAEAWVKQQLEKVQEGDPKSEEEPEPEPTPASPALLPPAEPAPATDEELEAMTAPHPSEVKEGE